jgi:hypothetical protein
MAGENVQFFFHVQLLEKSSAKDHGEFSLCPKEEVGFDF